MGGGDKSLRAARRPAAACARASPAWRRRSARIAISANGDPARFAAVRPAGACRHGRRLSRPAGRHPRRHGWAARPRRDPCSQPADRHAVLSGRPRRLASADAPSRHARCLAASGGRRHPAVGLWPVDLAAPLADFLLSGDDLQGLGLRRRHAVPSSVDFPMIELAGAQHRPVLQRQQPGRPRRGRSACWRSSSDEQRVFGITGWKNSGKTTLTEKTGRRAHAAAAGASRRSSTRTMISTSTAKAPTASATGRPAPREVAIVSGTALGADARTARRGRADAGRRSWRGWRRATSCWSKATSARRTPRSRRGGWTPRTPTPLSPDDPHIRGDRCRPSGRRRDACRFSGSTTSRAIADFIERRNRPVRLLRAAETRSCRLCSCFAVDFFAERVGVSSQRRSESAGRRPRALCDWRPRKT